MARSALAGIRRLCLALPETAETLTWGQPHFRVRGKIFAGFGDHGGKATLGFKLEREHADAVVKDPRFARAPYVGAHGWISMDAAGIGDWDEVRAFLVESYRLIAPRKCWEAFLAGGSGAVKRAGPKRVRAARPVKRTARRARR
jgi:predicted DNA-binding protein (MmcQ/YjbR family)